MKAKYGSTPATQYLPLILSIFFIGTSGPLGKLIHYSPVAIIAFRSIIGLSVLLLIIRLKGISFRIANREQRKFVIISGILLAAHWVAYFQALKLSTVALAMLSMFTYPLITVILEPFYLKKKFHRIQIPLALVAMAGIYCILPAMNVKNEHTLGVLIGIGSAFLFAARNLIIKKHAGGINGLVLISHQLFVVILFTSPLILFFPVSLQAVTEDWYYLLFLGVVTTAMGHSYYIKSLEYFSVSTVSLLSNFTPVIGIVLGILFLQEKLSANILIGGSLILLTAIVEVWLGKKNKDEIIQAID